MTLSNDERYNNSNYAFVCGVCMELLCLLCCNCYAMHVFTGLC